MSRAKSTFVENYDFIRRFVNVCGTQKPSEIARLLNVSPQTAKNYLTGRLPNATVLKTIAELTPYSIHWLLTGEGNRLVFVEDEPEDMPELNNEIRAFIREVCKEAVGQVFVEIKTENKEKVFVLSPDEIMQEKILENPETVDK